MPLRPFMRSLLDGAARREELEALHATEQRAREVKAERADESWARHQCRPWPAPVDVEPRRSRA